MLISWRVYQKTSGLFCQAQAQLQQQQLQQQQMQDRHNGNRGGKGVQGEGLDISQGFWRNLKEPWGKHRFFSGKIDKELLFLPEFWFSIQYHGFISLIFRLFFKMFSMFGNIWKLYIYGKTFKCWTLPPKKYISNTFHFGGFLLISRPRCRHNRSRRDFLASDLRWLQWSTCCNGVL